MDEHSPTSQRRERVIRDALLHIKMTTDLSEEIGFLPEEVNISVVSLRVGVLCVFTSINLSFTLSLFLLSFILLLSWLPLDSKYSDRDEDAHLAKLVAD